jgi:hypothetical protein
MKANMHLGYGVSSCLREKKNKKKERKKREKKKRRRKIEKRIVQ